MERLAAAGVAIFVAAGLAIPSHAEDVQVVGVTAAMTGPLASAYGPVGDGMRIYIDKLNAGGGIGGKRVRLVIRDDQSDATRGAANVKRLIEEDNVQLLVNDSASTTYNRLWPRSVVQRRQCYS
jgi:branched-chain amino acid transport system substrate-binding protein